MSFWFNVDVLEGGNYVVAAQNLNILGENDSTISVFNDVPVARGKSVSANTWNHVAVTWDDATTSFDVYLNGVSVGSSDSAATVMDAGWATFNLGTYDAGDNDNNIANSFIGEIYDVQIYDNVLSSTDVANLSNNAGSVIPEPATIGMLGLGAVLTLLVRSRLC
ncbi:hypothetical protein SCARR_04073 [Pontiella sulfatireligans]|uniref:Ice-binding protein C-terminal domain-containing protein n=2 Tax=Pontiella sulfatireligans TaxID=2750658 RepID=A0A6C2UPY6_9BACT|nr:hypothetical protein SCARR_04073 [Pontiella sulfatireligans]